MNIGLYFGSFNPIHNGHLIIANHMLNFTEIQKIWFVVSPQNPLKESRTLLNEHHRKHLIDLCLENDNRMKSSDVEFKLPRPSYTVDTLVHLQEKFPKHEFTIIMGSDSFKNIRNWKNPDVLLENYRIKIYSRPGFPVDPKLLSDTVTIVKAPLLQISSSFIRNLVKEKKSIRYLVPEIVNEEIQNQQFYFTNFK